MSPLRTLLAVVAAEVAAVATTLAAIYASSFVGTDGAEVSAEDLFGFVSVSAVATLVLCLVVYTPGLLLLCRRRTCAPRPLFLLAASVLLNIPAAVLLLLGLRARAFSGLGEVMIFLLVFLVAGFVFGLVSLRGRSHVETTQRQS